MKLTGLPLQRAGAIGAVASKPDIRVNIVDISECVYEEVAEVQILNPWAELFLLLSVASNLVAAYAQLEGRERLHLGQEIDELGSGDLLQSQHVLLLRFVCRDIKCLEWTLQQSKKVGTSDGGVVLQAERMMAVKDHVEVRESAELANCIEHGWSRAPGTDLSGVVECGVQDSEARRNAQKRSEDFLMRHINGNLHGLQFL
jgi:hypothetical protein